MGVETAYSAVPGAGSVLKLTFALRGLPLFVPGRQIVPRKTLLVPLSVVVAILQLRTLRYRSHGGPRPECALDSPSSLSHAGFAGANDGFTPIGHLEFAK